ncbi:MAG: SGNH/GDSL hydrolase family protein [Bacteroidota bacterium]
MDRAFHSSWVYLLLMGLLFSCNAVSPEPTPAPPEIPTVETPAPMGQFLALGDSYTIGQSVAEADRWPNQLDQRLRADSIELEAVRFLATTGWTTSNLKSAIANTSDFDSLYSLVSLLIGVNNQYQRKPFSLYETEFPELLSQALAFTGQDSQRVFVVSIPDYAYTPFGQSSNPNQISVELNRYNAFADSVCQSWGIAYFNITPISRQGIAKPEYVASDGLHPSGEMYEAWVELMYEEVKAKMQEE